MSTGSTQRRKHPTGGGTPKKVYVKSGQLEWVGLATGPLDAIQRALEQCGNGKVLDSSYFYIDERGFRDFDEEPEYKVPISKGLSHAGYNYDDTDKAGD